jgi:hypothetical protein
MYASDLTNCISSTEFYWKNSIQFTITSEADDLTCLLVMMLSRTWTVEDSFTQLLRILSSQLLKFPKVVKGNQVMLNNLDV